MLSEPIVYRPPVYRSFPLLVSSESSFAVCFSIAFSVFNQRRKMLRVSLRQIFGGSASPEFYAQDIMTKRPEQLSVQQFVELTNMVAEEAQKIGKTL